ncbi:unnamed protein product [Thlaspi arvense]|uniref:PORR domain-containing protein n=1 Tax=Thlaspi arvense TaxID=13288 RepID=A0AAU9T614_THLAR|nr:unnamed protein product [Thlaspi arvense]
MAALAAKLGRSLQQRRNFVNARVKWVGDPYLDEAVQRENNLKQLLSLKDRIVSSPSKSLPLSSLSLLKPLVNLHMTVAAFFQKFPSVFTTFQPSRSLPLHVRLTPQALALHKEEETIHLSPPHRNATVQRLTKFLMLTGAGTLPLSLVDRFRFDLGLPHDYITSLIGDYPDYFEVTEIDDRSTGEKTLALALSSRRSNLAVSEMERREATIGGTRVKKGLRIRYSMNFPKGYELDKRVKNWVELWQNLPYISPYENAFHLGPSSDQAEKWAVAVLHELLYLLVSKKTETDNVLCLGEYLGFGMRFKKALVHHPGIFYMSHKIRTQTVVLREAYHKIFLLEKHPLMGMRHRSAIPKMKPSYTMEIVCVSVLIGYAINYFIGKRENENLALAWARKFGLKDSIFGKNFSLLGVGETEDSPLLLKEATNVFKFKASGRRYCHGLLATMELKSRHDLISRLFNSVGACKDEISFEVYMNDEAMDHIVFAMARKKAAKAMHKELRDLQRFGGIVPTPGGRKWVSEELSVVSESKEVAGDMITDIVLDQVFGDKSFEKFGKYFISMQFSDQLAGKHRKMLLFKFALPDAKHMDDLVRWVALIPYYIDLVGRYKLSPQVQGQNLRPKHLSCYRCV